MEMKSNPISPENSCVHHWIIEGSTHTCKKCGTQKTQTYNDVPKFRNFTFSSRKPTTEKRLSAIESNMLSIAKLKLRGLDDNAIGEELGISYSNVSKIKVAFTDRYAPSITSARIGFHTALQKMITRKIIPLEELTFLPDIQPEFNDVEVKIRDLYSLGHVPESIADQLDISKGSIKHLCASILERNGVSNTYSLAGWVAREKIREEEAKRESYRNTTQ